MDRRVVARFFRVQAHNKTPPLHEMLREVATRPIESVFRTVGSMSVRVERIADDGHLTGEFVRFQTENIPGSAGRKTPQASLVLPDGHALIHGAAFAYAPQSKMLILQNNRNGVTPGLAATYFSSLCSDSGHKYRLLPILRNDAVDRLNKMVPSKFEVRVAAPEDLSAVDDDQLTTRECLQNMKDIAGGSTVEISVSGGRSGTPLRIRSVGDLVSWLYKEVSEGRGGIEKLRITGQHEGDPEAERIALDLLKEILNADEELSFSRTDIEANYNIRRAFMLRHLNQYAPTALADKGSLAA